MMISKMMMSIVNLNMFARKRFLIPICLVILATVLSYESDIEYNTKSYSLESKLPVNIKPDFANIYSIPEALIRTLWNCVLG